MPEKRTVLSVSFKESEYWILEKLKEYSCPSATIKDIIKKYFKEEELKNIGKNHIAGS